MTTNNVFCVLFATTTMMTTKWNGTTVFAQTKNHTMVRLCLLFCWFVCFGIYFRVIVNNNNNNNNDDDEKCVLCVVCNNNHDDDEMEC